MYAKFFFLLSILTLEMISSNYLYFLTVRYAIKAFFPSRIRINKSIKHRGNSHDPTIIPGTLHHPQLLSQRPETWDSRRRIANRGRSL